MSVFRVLLLYVAIVFFGGAAIAPWPYHGAAWMAERWPAFHDLAEEPFRRYVNRCLLVLAIGGLWPLLKTLQVTQGLKSGLRWDRTSARLFGLGFATGLVSLALAAAVTLSAGGHVWEGGRSVGDLLDRFVSAALSGIVVGLLEEVLFRAGLFGALRRDWSWGAAALMSSAVYAIVHFFSRPTDPEIVHWYSGFVTLAQMLGGFADLQRLFPGFINLTLVGIALAICYQRTASLWTSIGLHAGWVFWIKSFGFVTDEIPEANGWFWGGRDLIDGWLVFGVLVGTIVFLLRARAFSVPTQSTEGAPGAPERTSSDGAGS